MFDIALGTAGLAWATLWKLQAICLVAAVFSGLSGFGFSAIGAVLLWVVDPGLAISLLMALSLATQLSSIGQLRTEMRSQLKQGAESFLPCMAGGIVGLPLGLWVLADAPTAALLWLLGVLLVVYGAWGLFKPSASAAGPTKAGPFGAVSVGLLGGLIGGFSAFPGSAIVVWAGWRNLPKEQARALTQPFILAMQAIGLTMMALAHPERFSPSFWLHLVVALPAALLGTRWGVMLYRRSSHTNHRRITLVALTVAGASLLVKALWASP